MRARADPINSFWVLLVGFLLCSTSFDRTLRACVVGYACVLCDRSKRKLTRLRPPVIGHWRRSTRRPSRISRTHARTWHPMPEQHAECEPQNGLSGLVVCWGLCFLGFVCFVRFWVQGFAFTVMIRCVGVCVHSKLTVVVAKHRILLAVLQCVRNIMLVKADTYSAQIVMVLG